jgi:hypothetical protein
MRMRWRCSTPSKPDAMTAAESSTGWPERVRALRGEILAKLGVE